jgi:hypothetical protein
MRTRSSVLAIAGAIAASLPAAPLVAQACLGLPSDRGSVTFGFDGTDGGVGLSAGLVVRSGRMSVGLTHSSINRFAQDDHVASTGVRVAWPWSDGSPEVCFVGGAEWTSYEAGSSSSEWTDSGTRHRQYYITGDFDRIRTPVGVSFGRAFWAGQRVSINPFVTLGAVHDYERMRWAGGGVETRNRFGPEATVGFTARLGSFLLRSQLDNVWTGDRALSGHNDRLELQMQVGWAF